MGRFSVQDGETAGLASELGEWAALRGLQLLCKGAVGAVGLLDDEAGPIPGSSSL